MPGWIREGRIQYKEADTTKIITHCIVCGEPIRFGTVCSRCLRTQNMSGTETALKVSDPGGMWFLGNNE